MSPIRRLLLLALLPLSAFAAEGPAPALLERADKIVATLHLADAAQTARVRDLVAGQYHALAQIHDARDAKLAALKADATLAAPAREAARTAALDAADAAQMRAHYTYLAALSVELDAAQIEQIKDGMTYGVAPNTFRVYQEMLPTLTAEQKRQILAWLREAREHAMDAGSSKEKHAWFGKYKGRINNYLAKAGIDMKQAEKDMFTRQKAAP